MITDAVQVGSLVPAESAELHVIDAVHTRMGASDNLAMGSSTFLEVWHPPHLPFPGLHSNDTHMSDMLMRTQLAY